MGRLASALQDKGIGSGDRVHAHGTSIVGAIVGQSPADHTAFWIIVASMVALGPVFGGKLEGLPAVIGWFLAAVVVSYAVLLVGFGVAVVVGAVTLAVIVATGIANRKWVEVESLIGFFVNTLMIRTDLSRSPTFRELLSRVRKVILEAYAHQDLPV